MGRAEEYQAELIGLLDEIERLLAEVRDRVEVEEETDD